MITLSASIVVYNENIDVLSRVLQSFESIELEKELIVVDNSIDNRLKKVTEKFSSIRYIHSEKNIGFGAGHNLAFAHRQNNSDLHLIINPDTFFDPIQIFKMAQWHISEAKIVLSVPKILYPDGSPQFICRNIPTPWILGLRRLNIFGIFETFIKVDELNRTLDDDVRSVPFCHGCFMMFNTDTYKELNGFDEQFFLYMEDVDIFIRSQKIGRTVQNPKFEVFHEFRKGSSKSLKLLWHHLYSAWKFFRKYR